MNNSCPTVESGEAGRAPSCQGCPNASVCASAQPDPSIPLIKDKLKSIELKVAVMSGKGGVGKSTISMNLAHSLSHRGFNVILVDLDISGPSIPRMSGTADHFLNVFADSIEPVPVSDRLFTISVGHLSGFDNESSAFNSLRKNDILKLIFKKVNLTGIQIMVIDTPPNISDEHLALAQYLKPDVALMVSTPQKIVLDDVIRQVSFCSKAGIPLLGIVENMRYFRCPGCKHVNTWGSSRNTEEFCTEKSIEYLGSIELDAEIAKAADSGVPVKSPVIEHIVDRILVRREKI